MTTKEKSIVILHAHNTFNNGSFMMLINFINQLHLHIPEDSLLTIWIELDGEENEDRFQQSLKSVINTANNIEIKYLPVKITSPENVSFFTRLVKLYKKLFYHPRLFKKMGINTIIVLGGDDISEYYKKWMIISDLYRLFLYSKKFTVILAGQSIGPFKGIREKIAGICLAKCIIYSRDGICTQYVIKNLKHNHLLSESADLAFPDLPDQIGSDLLKKYNLLPGQYITIVPGGFYKLYSSNRNVYITCWQKFISDLQSFQPLLSKKIVFLPHVTRPEDDRKIITDFKENLLNNESRNIYINEEFLPHQLREILGNGYLTITSRLHAAISTFQMCKPAMAIGYSTKYEGVIGRSLQFHELTVYSVDALFSSPALFSKEMLHVIKYIEKNYNEIIDKLKMRIPVLKKMAMDQVSSIAEIIFQE